MSWTVALTITAGHCPEAGPVVVRPPSNEYQCSGYGISNAGEVCYVEGSDDDANGNWEDSNSHIKEQTCGGDLIEDPIDGGPGDGM